MCWCAIRLPFHGTSFQTPAGEFVILLAETYDRIKSLLALSDVHPSDAYAAVDRAFAERWDHPAMDQDHLPSGRT